MKIGPLAAENGTRGFADARAIHDDYQCWHPADLVFRLDVTAAPGAKPEAYDAVLLQPGSGICGLEMPRTLSNVVTGSELGFTSGPKAAQSLLGAGAADGRHSFLVRPPTKRAKPT